ncbi:uncharacterized protein LOC134659059 [Cydia amplana]|uniref:uncharacterized protein LOC134659059 n=1 Tax=Cydia amplana TaxID=1869771 RepID=UPI002FE53BDD
MAEGAEHGVVGLKPPEKLLNQDFKKWKQRFELYRKASGADKKEDQIQVALLLHCMGEACIDIYNTLNLDETATYIEVIAAFESYYIPKKNESVNSHMFFTRNQLEGENFDNYLTELRKLAKECDFGTLEDRLIKDKIVSGVYNKKLTDRLLREPDLSLTKAINICKAAELANEQVKQIQGKSSVEKTEVQVIKKKSIARKEQASTNGSKGGGSSGSTYHHQASAGTSKSSSSGSTYHHQESRHHAECYRCGYSHERNKCPAYGKTCSKCGKLGHFIRKCRWNKIGTVRVQYYGNTNPEDQGTSDSDSQEIDISMVSNKKSKSSSWYENVHFVEQNKDIKFKLDSGAGCNIIPRSLCHKMNIFHFEKSNCHLTNYSEESISTVGELNLKCKILNKECVINLQTQALNLPAMNLRNLPMIGHLSIKLLVQSTIKEMV